MTLNELIKTEEFTGKTLLIQPLGVRSGGLVIAIGLQDGGMNVVRADCLTERMTIGLDEEVDVVDDELTDLEARLTELIGLLQDTAIKIQGGSYTSCGPVPMDLLELSGRCHYALESAIMASPDASVKLLRQAKAERLARM
jgi:hypothetical protein